MSKDNQFTAIGDANHTTEVGFQTNSASPGGGPINRGADIAGDIIGVRGTSTNGIGVHGTSTNGSGVFGDSAQGRGGAFRSHHQAQLQLQPQLVSTNNVIPTPVEDSRVPRLPKDGKAGDLFAADFGSGDQGNCQLWFCVKDPANGNAAKWRQVTLGGLVDGVS